MRLPRFLVGTTLLLVRAAGSSAQDGLDPKSGTAYGEQQEPAPVGVAEEDPVTPDEPTETGDVPETAQDWLGRLEELALSIEAGEAPARDADLLFVDVDRLLDVQYEKAMETDITLRVLEVFASQGIRPPALLHRAVDAPETVEGEPTIPLAPSASAGPVAPG